PRYPQHFREPNSVAGRFVRRGVVEIAENVARRARTSALRRDPARIARLLARAPLANAPAPATERFVRVTAHVQLLAAVQADVHELGGDIFIFRPLARRIRDDESDPMLAQKGDERRIDDAFVPHFEHVTKGTARTE